ncbi:MAG: metallophosphoesterase [Sedimentisphaerales bacterium]|nr:metallophosphoesterase [Sedimentisphaerales bacterium]
MGGRSSLLMVLAIVLAPMLAGWGMSVEHMGTEPLWKAAVISDTQTGQKEWLISIFNQLLDAEPDMVLHVGDTHFDWSDGFTIRALACLLRSKPGGLEFHLAPGNHDMDGDLLESHLRRAAIEGLFRTDRGITFKGSDYALKRVSEFVPNPILPPWNPEILDHPAWQGDITKKMLKKEYPDVLGCRYVFKRGGIRFIVCDWDYSREQTEWIRDIITRPDDSSVSIVLHHYHNVGQVSRYFKGLEGRHNVKLVLMGHDHSYDYEVRDGITYVRLAGIAHHERECDSLILNVYEDYLRLDRYVIPESVTFPAVLGPEPIWICPGRFAKYERPETAKRSWAYIGDTPVEKDVFYEQAK